nr:F-box protein SKIP19-like [Nicotiana tomentosiformis]
MEVDMENLFTPPWLELPPEITSTILQKLGTIEILRNADKVCTTWRRLCEDPAMWRVINMRDNVWDMLEGYLEQICREAVDRSQGQLIDINLEYFGSDNLLYYIAERSPQLKRLRLLCSYNVSGEALSAALKKCPLLEELHLYHILIGKESIENIGRSCRALKSFKLNNQEGM